MVYKNVCFGTLNIHIMQNNGNSLWELGLRNTFGVRSITKHIKKSSKAKQLDLLLRQGNTTGMYIKLQPDLLRDPYFYSDTITNCHTYEWFNRVAANNLHHRDSWEKREEVALLTSSKTPWLSPSLPELRVLSSPSLVDGGGEFSAAGSRYILISLLGICWAAAWCFSREFLKKEFRCFISKCLFLFLGTTDVQHLLSGPSTSEVISLSITAWALVVTWDSIGISGSTSSFLSPFGGSSCKIKLQYQATTMICIQKQQPRVLYFIFGIFS